MINESDAEEEAIMDRGKKKSVSFIALIPS
jgi:hypothetical protein